MNLLNIFKNNLYRTLAQKATIIIAFILIPIVIGMAVLFTKKAAGIKGNIAYVSDNPVIIPKDSRINVQVLNKKPSTSSLLLGKYIAIVEKNNNKFTVTTLKNRTDKEAVETFFKTGKVPVSSENGNSKKGTGTNILGFLLMILLMQGVALITLYVEDRDKQTLKRVLMSPVNERMYLLAQESFTFLSILIPSYLTLAVVKLIFRVDIGFSYWMLFLLVAIISALSTSLALLIASVFGTEYSLISTLIYILTSLLSGCYISFTGSSKLLDKLCNVFPQKAYMTMVQGIENGKGLHTFSNQLIYLLIWITAAYLFGSIVNRKKVQEGMY